MKSVHGAKEHESTMTHSGEVLIFGGPHGVGKDTIERTFVASRDDTTHHVRYSSRAMAPGERDGETYHFISPDSFHSMVDDAEFIDYAHYPEGSCGIGSANLLRDIQTNRYTSLTTNFEEGLRLSQCLAKLRLTSRCLFLGPCPEDTMLEEPNTYLDILEHRMELRARATDDIRLRLSKAALYREMYIEHQDTITYIANEDGKQNAALEQINAVLLP